MKPRRPTQSYLEYHAESGFSPYARQVYSGGAHLAGALDSVIWWSRVNTGMHVPVPPETRLLRLDDVVEATTLSKSLIYALIRVGAFPEPVRLSENRVAWTEAAIRRWIEHRSGTAPSTGGRE